MSKAKKRKPAKQTSRDSESPEAVLAAIDKFVASRRANVDRLTERLIKAKRADPQRHNELQAARFELSEALRLRVRVAKVVMDIQQRLRMIENSARFAIATAFAEYQQRTSRG
jgi:hypothetical protein